MKKRLLITAILIFVIGSVTGQTLRIGAGNETAPYYPLIKEILEEAGISSELVVQPAGRSLENANKGLLDGELLRVISIEANFPNLVRVPTPMLTTTVYAYTLVNGPVIEQLIDLKPLKVATVRGQQISMQLLNSIEATVTYVATQAALVQMLKSGRVQAVTNVGALMDPLVRGDQSIRRNEPPIFSITAHIFLHKKHEGLIPRIDAVIREWGAERIAERIQELSAQ